MAVVAALAVISEIVSDRDEGGTPVEADPVPEIESESFVIGHDPRDVIFDGEKLWVAETGFGTVTSYGLEGQRLDSADVDGQPARLAAGAGFVWALDADDGSVTQLDNNAEVLRHFQIGDQPAGMEFFGEHLWVTDPGRHSLSKITLQGGLARLLEVDVSPGAITKTPEQVLIADGDSPIVTGFDAGGDLIGSFEYPDLLDVGGLEHVPGAPTDFLSTPESLWIAFGEIGQVMRLTPAGTYSGLTRVPTGPLSLAWSGNELWVASADAGSVTRISGDGEIVATHMLGGKPTGIAHDGERAWIVDEDKNTLVMLTPVAIIP